MAYTAVVEKQAVRKISNTLFSVSVKLTVNDGTEDVFDCTATARYNSNTPDLDNIKAGLIAELKERWDKYAAENGVYSAAAFDTMVGEIQTMTNGYINQ